jgi:hypothetical protein
LTSAEVIGWPSDHFWFANSVNVTAFLSGATVHFCAIPGTGPRSLVPKSVNRRQLTDQMTKSSSSSSMNGLSVWGSCSQPSRMAVLPSWAPAGAASANTNANASAQTQTLLMCHVSRLSRGEVNRPSPRWTPGRAAYATSAMRSIVRSTS